MLTHKERGLPTISQADCVFPTRTARFGVALTFSGPLNLSMPIFAKLGPYSKLGTELGKHTKSMDPIDKDCPCPTCVGGMSRAMLHHIATIETAGAHGNSDSASCDLLANFLLIKPSPFTTLCFRLRLWAVLEMLSSKADSPST